MTASGPILPPIPRGAGRITSYPASTRRRERLAKSSGPSPRAGMERTGSPRDGAQQKRDDGETRLSHGVLEHRALPNVWPSAAIAPGRSRGGRERKRTPPRVPKRCRQLQILLGGAATIPRIARPPRAQAIVLVNQHVASDRPAHLTEAMTGKQEGTRPAVTAWASAATASRAPGPLPARCRTRAPAVRARAAPA